MCYMIYLSTSAPDELTCPASPHYRLAPIGDIDDPEIVDLLRHPRRWFLESKYGGCSCHFRQLDEGGCQEFLEPADWFDEDPEDVEATRAVYDLLDGIVSAGHEADVVCIWNGADPKCVADRDVSMAGVSREAFLFFENCRFAIGP